MYSCCSSDDLFTKITFSIIKQLKFQLQIRFLQDYGQRPMFLLSFKKLKLENLHDDNNISSLYSLCTDVWVSNRLSVQETWLTGQL